MKKSRLLLSVILLFIILSSTSNRLVAFEDTEQSPTILIIHAYHLGYEWTSNQDAGIREVLKETYPEASIYTEFLDWKRFPNEEGIKLQYQDFKNKYKDVDIDLILTTDDKALEFAILNRQELFTNAPIAFSGIIDFTAKEIIGKELNITGVYEKMKPEGVLELIQELQPTVTKLKIIHDLTESGNRTNDNLMRALENFQNIKKFDIEDLSNLSFDEISNRVATYNVDTAVILISYNITSDGIIIKPEVAGKALSEVSAVPIYSIDEFLFGQGIVGGTFLSGILQGKQLASLGTRILQGEEATMIPHVSEATAYTGVDEDQLIRYELDKDNLADSVIILNENISFFEEYKTLVLTVVLIFISLDIFIVVLIYLVGINRKSKIEITKQKVELQDLYEQVQTSEEELRAQNEELQSYQEHLSYEAYHDYLTKLPNRNSLESYVTKIFSEAKSENKKIVVLFCDLDNFKFVNNAFGHQFGDEVLQMVGENLSRLSQDVFVARIGGDEFIIVKLIDKSNETNEISKLMLKLRKSFDQEIKYMNETIRITASIGYSVFPDDGETFDELFIGADMAMYNAKKLGKATVKRYKSEYRNELKNEHLMISNLKDAIIKEELHLVYQPIMDSRTDKTIGFEALLRWTNESLGSISPMTFIPLAESSGLIIPIGYYVIEESLSFAEKLLACGYSEFKVSINVSVIQLYEDDFVMQFIKRIEKSKVNPENLQIEVTENIMIDTYSIMTERLNELREYGVSIALDDFGTGYSSLSYLHELPIDVIKIDKMFIDDIDKHKDKVSLVDASITLAINFGYCSVAEGVESLEQLEYLTERGCNCIQGYYYSKPLSEEDALRYCERHDLCGALK